MTELFLPQLYNAGVLAATSLKFCMCLKSGMRNPWGEFDQFRM